MADDPLDPNPALRAEYEAALAVLAPEITGLHYLVNDPVKAELIGYYTEQITEREQRRDLIQAALNTLDVTIDARRTLAADGYPDLPKIEIPAEDFQEAQRQGRNIEAALGIFEAPPVASRISAELGQPEDKPRRSR